MTAPEAMTEDLRAVAEHADTGPADLAERVLGRYRRRRRNRTVGLLAGAAAVAVAVVVAVPAVFAAPHGGTPGQIAGIPAGPGIWRVPDPAAPLPDAAQVWPAAGVDLPPTTPDGGQPYALGSAGPHRVLVGSVHQGAGTGNTMDSLDIYDASTHTYRQIATVTDPAGRPWVRHFAVSDSRVYWGVDTDAGFDVYTVPLAGGQPLRLAQVSVPRPAGALPNSLRSMFAGPWFATDTAVYWSGSAPGIVRLAATGGTPQPVPGFEDMYLTRAGSPWAARLTGAGTVLDAPQVYAEAANPTEMLAHTGITTRLKNLLTAAVIDTSVPAGTTALACAPTVCVGVIPRTPATGATAGPDSTYYQLAEGPVVAFIQRPDGSDRVRLPATDEQTDVYTVFTVGDRGLVVSLSTSPAVTAAHGLGWNVSDPFTGVAGQILPTSDGNGGWDFVITSAVIGYPVPGNTPMTRYLVVGNSS